MGEAVPKTEYVNNLEAGLLWLAWGMRMTFIHLPTRLFVLPGDLCQHDWHHRAKFGDDWPNASYTRQNALANLTPNDEPYFEVWGMANAIDAVLESLSGIPSINSNDITRDIDSEAILGM